MTAPPPLVLRNPACTRCDLHATAKRVCVGARGDTGFQTGAKVKVLFVGEAPGVPEDATGRAFQGAAGRLLDEAIKEYGIRNYAITNAVKCFPQKPRKAEDFPLRPGAPPIENRKPHKKELAACRGYLLAEIATFDPEIIVPLGGTALEAVTGLKKITDWAGRSIECPEFPGRMIFPILHPAAILRASDRWLPAFEAQFKGLGRLASGKTPKATTYTKVTLDGAIERLGKIARDEGIFAIDFETGGKGRHAFNPKAGYLVTCAVSTAEGTGFWWEWPRGKPDLDLCTALVAACTKGTMIAHNAVFEVKWILWHAARFVLSEKALRALEWPVFDTMLLYYLLHEDAKGSYGLEHLARELTDMGGYDDKIQALIADGKQHHEIDMEILGEYNAADADCTMRAFKVLIGRVKDDPDLYSVYDTILRPTVFSVAWTEIFGRKVDSGQVEKVTAELVAQEKKGFRGIVRDPAAQAVVSEQGPGGFNPNSQLQMGKVLFDGLGIPSLGKTDGGKPSLDSKYLEPFRADYPLVDHYLNWKQARTLRNNYLEPIAAMVEADGFLYGSYLINGTATGRLASIQPNLQNFHKSLRRIVVSRFVDGFIVEPDYSQLELRLMAWLADCTPLLEAFRNGEDVHRLTASKVLNKPLKDVTPDERQDKGKRPNFALLYGALPKRFAIEFGVSMDEARFIYLRWHAAYPEIATYHKRIHAKVARTGVLRSNLGRLRRLPAAQGDFYPRSQEAYEQILAFLQASNFPCQSLASDLNTMAFNGIRRATTARGMKVMGLGLTHDSGTYDCPRDEIADFVPVIRTEMVEKMHKRFPWIEVPLEIDIKAGPTWGDLKPLKDLGLETDTEVA